MEVTLPWAVLIALVELPGDVLAEYFLAFFAGKDNFGALHNFVVFALHVALGTVKPLFATLGTDLHLSVQNVFAHLSNSNLIIYYKYFL